jgi:hypothetical protein
MADEIIKRLEEQKNVAMLEELYSSVMEKERKKGQRHKVFEDSPACRQAGLMRKNAIQISLCIIN